MFKEASWKVLVAESKFSIHFLNLNKNESRNIYIGLKMKDGFHLTDTYIPSKICYNFFRIQARMI